MTPQRPPTLRTQAMGNKLRELRTQAGFELSEVAQHLGRDKSGISRMETGMLPIPSDVLDALLTLYAVSEPGDRHALQQFAKEAWRTGWWSGYADDVQASLIDHVWLEERATEIQTLNLAGFNGLLQTAGYARALMVSFDPTADPDDIENWVGLRVRRQAVLDRARPPHLLALMSEAALWSEVGGRDVLADQIRHVIEQSRRPNVEVRIVPFSNGAQAGHTSDLRIFLLPQPFGTVVVVDANDLIYLESPHSERPTAGYHRLLKNALDPDESVALMAARADELETG